MTLPRSAAIVFAFVCAVACAQSNQPDPGQMLLYAAEQSTIETPETSPFHLLGSFNTFDYLGAPSGSGTLEVWWDGKNRTRHVTTYRGETQTLVRIDGKPTIEGDYPHTYIVDRLLIGGLFAPSPFRADTLEALNLELKAGEILGGVDMDCITLGPITPPVQHPYQAPPESFCISAKTKLLRASRHGWHYTVAYNSILPFGQKQFARDLTVTQDGFTRATFHMKINPWQPDETTFVPPPGAHPWDPKSIPAPPASGTPGHIVNHPEPIYPDDARHRHIEGRVILSATITREGTVTDLEVSYSPDPVLSVAAIQAVKQWTYTPYLVNGAPSATHTTINVNFAFK